MSLRLSDLEVYTLSVDLSNIVWNIVTTWNTFEKNTVGKQLVRSADSISANIAESFGRYHYKEKLKFAFYARGSFEETSSWIDKCEYRGLMKIEQVNLLNKYIQLIGPKLNGFINVIRNPRQV